MRRSLAGGSLLFWPVVGTVVAAGCASGSVADEPVPTTTYFTTSTTTGSSTGAGGGGLGGDGPGASGAGGSATECTPGASEGCYEGPDETRNVGECADGTRTCDDDGSWGACEEQQLPSDELCNSLDDDCNGEPDDEPTDEGAGCEAGGVGECDIGAMQCTDGELVCTAVNVPMPDICDGLDNDCNASTPDGHHDPDLDEPCDGPDADECAEGVFSCVDGNLVCDDETGDIVEVCNGADDDCDGVTDEDVLLDDNPVCTAGTTFIGTVQGDDGSDEVSASAYDEEWLRATIDEDNNLPVYLSATVGLWSPAGVDFDLYVHCDGCSGVARSSTVAGTTGHWDVVDVRNGDDWGSDDDFDIVIEVRYKSGAVCAAWDLSVWGNTEVSSYLDCD